MNPQFNIEAVDLTGLFAEPITFSGNLDIPRDLRDNIGPTVTLIDPAEHYRRINYALSLDLPSVAELADKWLGETVEIVGSGPSLVNSLGYLAETKNPIIATNGSHDYLLNCGIKPTFATMLDPHDWCATYQRPTEGVIYLMGSSVHPKVWQRFGEAGIKPYLYLPMIDDVDCDTLMEKFRDYTLPADSQAMFTAGPTTVGLRTVYLMAGLGFITMGLHGFDSCYAPGNDGIKSTALHAHPKHYVHNDAREITLKAKRDGRQFSCRTNNAMARQILGFESMVNSMGNFICNGRLGLLRVIVHGDGAIPWMAWADGHESAYMQHATPEKMAAKYGQWANWDYVKDKPL